jgi:murein L,D-transpeptidase YafK
MYLSKTIGLFLLGLIVVLTIYYFYPEKKLPADASINKLIVLKSKRQLLAYSNAELLKTYTISLGANPVGDKEYEGDKKTPEGKYVIYAKSATSCCHKNLGISYPDKQDLEKAKQLKKPAGGDIKIHGLGNGLGFIGKFQRWLDWTSGCIGVTDEEVDELFRAVAISTPIEIRP